MLSFARICCRATEEREGILSVGYPISVIVDRLADDVFDGAGAVMRETHAGAQFAGNNLEAPNGTSIRGAARADAGNALRSMQKRAGTLCESRRALEGDPAMGWGVDDFGA